MHPKVLAAGALPALIQLRAICYASQHRTDGFIPLSVIPLLLIGFDQLGIDLGTTGAVAAVGCHADDVDWPPVMLNAGLWEPREGGYYIHDYLEWNLSKKQHDTMRKAFSKAGKKGMKSRWSKSLVSDNPPDNQPNNHSITSHSTSYSSSSLSSPEGKRKRERKGENGHGRTAFPSDWHPTADELTPWRAFGINPDIEFAAFRDHAKSIGRRLVDWKAGFRNWCRKAITRKQRG